MDTTFLDRLTREVSLVTPEQIAAAGASLGPLQEGDEKLFTLLNRPDIQRIWALAHEYDKRGAQAVFEAKYLAKSSEEKTAALPKIAQLNAMENLLRKMTWLAIREVDLNLYDAECLTLRAGFLVVKRENPASQSQRRLQEILRGPLAKILGVQVVEADDDDDEDDDGKIQ